MQRRNMGKWCAGVVVGWCLMLGATAQAQTVTNPKVVEFTVSADHNRLLTAESVSVPVLTRYEIRFYMAGAPQPVSSFDLGKPVAADGATVTITNVAIFAPLDTAVYTARVVGIGPGGEGVSDATVPFVSVKAPRMSGAPTLRP
jgi:hypothetical protein